MKFTKSQIVGLVLGLVAFFAILLIPIDGLEPAGQKGLAIVLLTGIFWIFQVLPYAYTGLMSGFLFVAMGCVGFTTAFAGFAQASTWMILFSLIFAKGFEKSGLGLRVGLALLRMFKKLSYGKLLLVFLLLLLLGNIFVPAVAGFIVIVFGLLQGVLAGLGLPTNERTELSAGLGCYVGILGLLNGKNFITGVIGNSIISGMMANTYNTPISYSQWLATFAVMIPIPMIATFFYLKKKYKPDVNFDDPKLYEELKARQEALGKIKPKEIMVAVIMVLALVFWITGWGGFSVQLVTGILGLFMALPKIGVLEYEDFCGIQYPLFVFNGAATSLGTVLSALSIDAWVADKLMVFDIFKTGSELGVAATFLLIMAVTHIFMESLCQISFFMPVMMKMGVLAPQKVACIVSSGTHIYQFPFQAAPVAMSLGFGICNGRDVASYGIFISIVSIAQTLVALALGWPVMPGF